MPCGLSSSSNHISVISLPHRSIAVDAGYRSSGWPAVNPLCGAFGTLTRRAHSAAMTPLAPSAAPVLRHRWLWEYRLVASAWLLGSLDGTQLIGGYASAALSAICQHACLAMPCAAGCRLDPLVRMSWGRCGVEHGAGKQRVGAALASHGRGHRFETCHAHQPKRLPGSLQPAVCQKICQKTGACGWSHRSASLNPSRRQATRLLCAVNSASANSASSATHGLPTCRGSAGG
jgi:hypothetical protein